jgi:hypothetical protein
MNIRLVNEYVVRTGNHISPQLSKEKIEWFEGEYADFKVLRQA